MASTATVSVSIEGVPVVVDTLKKARYKLEALRSVLDIREAELLELKGPCSNTHCRLHYAHSGPCHVSEAKNGN